MGNAVSNIATDIPTYIASLQEQRIGPTIQLVPINTFQKNQQMWKNRYVSPINFLADQIKEPEMIDNFIEKSGSARPTPRYIAPPDPVIDQLRQRVLSSSNFRPAMKQFLASVPVVRRPLSEFGVAGEAVGNYEDRYHAQNRIPQYVPKTWEEPSMNQPRMIFIDRGMADSSHAGDILLHEYMHTAPRNMSLKEQFVQMSQRINPNKQPILWNISLQYFHNGKPPPNEEEVYATLGQQLGPRALLIPEIKDFYKNVFTQHSQRTPYSPFSNPELWKNGNLVE
jgi:hypothetical protein